MRDVGRLDSVSSKEDHEQWQNPDFILKIESMHILTDGIKTERE